MIFQFQFQFLDFSVNFSYSYSYSITTQRLVASIFSSALYSYQQHEQHCVCSDLYCVNTKHCTDCSQLFFNCQHWTEWARTVKHVLNNTCCSSSETHACTGSCSFCFSCQWWDPHTLKRLAQRKPARQVLIWCPVLWEPNSALQQCWPPRSLWHCCGLTVQQPCCTWTVHRQRPSPQMLMLIC